MKRKMIGLTLLLTLAAAAPAMAEAAGGGQWDHGTNTGSVYSNYVHPTNIHCSSVRGTEYNFSGAKVAHVESKASAPRAWLTTNEAYYNNNC